MASFSSLVYSQFEPAEMSVEVEKKNSLALLTKLENAPEKRAKRQGKDDVLNVRKAVRFASKGEGGVALARKVEGPPKKRSKPR